MLFDICQKISKSLSGECSKIIKQYSEVFLDMLDTIPPKEICHKMNLCAKIDVSGKLFFIDKPIYNLHLNLKQLFFIHV